MEKAFEFLSNHTLYFATSPHKEVYRQLQENPNIELLAMDGNISVRVTGRAVFDVPDEVGREIYAANPVLPRLYKQYTGGNTLLLELGVGYNTPTTSVSLSRSWRLKDETSHWYASIGTALMRRAGLLV